MHKRHTRNTTDPFKKIAHGGRLQSAAKLTALSGEQKVLDYGCGDGALFEYLEPYVPAENLYGFDPGLLEQMTFVGATCYDDPDVLVSKHKGHFDVVYCMEVCEHLNFDAMCELYKNIHSVAKRDGTVIFGVPLETGLSGFLKNIYRSLRGGRQGATFGRAIKSLFGLWIPRACAPRGAMLENG